MRSTLLDNLNFELALGIVPTFRSGGCDKSLEGYEGQPMPRHLREKRPIPKRREPPVRVIGLDSKGDFYSIDLRPIQLRAYQEEFGITEFERATNGAIYF